MSEDKYTLSEDDLAQARIVVVDDDPLVTSSLKNFLSLDMDVEPLTFNDSREARSYIEGHEIDLVISDFLMPELDGIQLLAAARRAQPEVPRVLLTGYADKENAIKAINEVQLFQYVEKPWDNDQLRHIVIAGLERQNLLRLLKRKLAELTETRSDLESLKKALVRAFA
ncbi:MAG: response regulator [Deltaproteobacteria bacterium]|nr:response regulator [Deltaproteobacteria bacterium]